MSTVSLMVLGVVIGILVLLAFPQLFCRVLAFLLRHSIVRLRLVGRENIPVAGPALLVANHVAFFDALIILGVVRRPVRFMVHENFFQYPALRLFFRYIGVLKVPSAVHVRAMREFLDEVRSRLRNGELVCVFPEGGISDNGLLQEFHDTVREMLPRDADVQMVPIRLGMLWGRLFTVHRGRLKFLPPRRLPIAVNVSVGRAVSPNLSGFELRQVISELGAEAECKPFSGELPLHGEFARRTRFRPWIRTYKDFGGADLRDFEMLVRALLLTRLVRKLDPKPAGGYVGVLLPNSTIQVAVLLAVLYADRTPAVLNYTAGSEALQAAIEKAGAELILTSRKFLTKLNLPLLPNMVCLEDVASEVTRAMKIRTTLAVALLPSSLLLRLYSPLSHDDLQRPAVLLFSSGSTGKPKGVMLSHRNINSNILSFWRGINWSPQDKVLGGLPLFHAFGFTVCFAFPLLSGTKSVFLANILDASSVVKLVREEQITLMITTPTFLQSYMRKATREDFQSLRLVITGAEKLRSDIVGRFRDLSGLTIVEGYGCTELSPIVCINLSSSFMELGREAGRPGSIGVAMPGVHTKIVDPDTGIELPPDVSGMLLVKGGLVMTGYLDDPDATAAVITGDGYYRTGDIASLSTDGHITITGRISRFSKIGGEMVPHEMVEHAIGEILCHEERSVAVTGKADGKRGEKLLVFYSAQELEADAIIRELRERKLPNLWIPKREDFVYIEALPLLGSGKLDLQALKRLAEKA